jgi:hypothetical protein
MYKIDDNDFESETNRKKQASTIGCEFCENVQVFFARPVKMKGTT